MSTFGEIYSKYYDLLYKDKNYQEEFDYIQKIISKHGSPGKNILDIGCGTGKHLKYFKDAGYNIAGVDLSKNMIIEAKKHLNQEEDLICSKASEFKFNKKFDIIISLFHVMSYQTSNDEIEKVFSNVREHLNNGGLFIFDFWYGPGVLTDQPTVRVKRLENDDISITRITEPFMHYNKNIVDVNFEVIIQDKKTNITNKIFETHKMRYLFLPEILFLAKKSELKIMDSYKWLDFISLSENYYYGIIILKNN